MTNDIGQLLVLCSLLATHYIHILYSCFNVTPKVYDNEKRAYIEINNHQLLSTNSRTLLQHLLPYITYMFSLHYYYSSQERGRFCDLPPSSISSPLSTALVIYIYIMHLPPLPHYINHHHLLLAIQMCSHHHMPHVHH